MLPNKTLALDIMQDAYAHNLVVGELIFIKSWDLRYEISFKSYKLISAVC